MKSLASARRCAGLEGATKAVLATLFALGSLAPAVAAQTAIGEAQQVGRISSVTTPILDSAILKDDYFGNAVAYLGDLDGDGVGDFAVGARRESLYYRGAIFILFMNADGSVRARQRLSETTPGLGASLVQEDSSEYCYSLANLGDVDGDGVVDLAVGERKRFSSGSSGRSLVRILFLNRDGSLKGFSLIDQTTLGYIEGRQFGAAVCGLGDQNGDGVPDMAVGAPREPVGGKAKGRVYLLFLDRTGAVQSHRILEEGTLNFPGTLADLDAFGTALASLGDRDGNGVTDLAVGAPGVVDGPHTSTGQVWVLHLRSKGTKVKSAVKIGQGSGGLSAAFTDVGESFGEALAGNVDVDGDGILDLLVGSPHRRINAPDEGLVRVLLLNADGTVRDHIPLGNGLGGLAADHLDWEHEFGRSLTAYDEEGDGQIEVAAGRFTEFRRDHGGVEILALAPTGQVTSTRLIDRHTSGLDETLAAFDGFGRYVAHLGDLDGDGISEIAASSEDRIWILFLDREGSVRDGHPLTAGKDLHPQIQLARSTGLCGLGDFDGDGVPDLAFESNALSPQAPGLGLWILFLDADGTPKQETKIGFSTGTHLPMGIASIGDLDGDGVTDLVAAGGYEGPDQTLWTVFLQPNGKLKQAVKTLVKPQLLAGIVDQDAPLREPSVLGDLDGDGNLELTFGQPEREEPAGLNFGAVWVLTLLPDGTFTHFAKIGAKTQGFKGTLAPGDYFGNSTASPGDLDQDGTPELLVGVDDFGTDPGGFWLLFLKPDASVKRYLRINHELGGGMQAGLTPFLRGEGAVSLGDFNRDGVPDVLFGEGSHQDDPGIRAGAVFVTSLSRGLWSDQREHSIATGAVQSLEIDAGSEHAGRTYQVFGSLAGAAPGFATSGRGLVMPLNDDGPSGYLVLSAIYPNGLILGDGLRDGLGILDAQGRATASFTTLPVLDPSFAGTEVHHAYAVFDPYPTEVVFTSNALGSILVP